MGGSNKKRFEGMKYISKDLALDRSAWKRRFMYLNHDLGVRV
jgi:hypothetical protein